MLLRAARSACTCMSTKSPKRGDSTTNGRPDEGSCALDHDPALDFLGNHARDRTAHIGLSAFPGISPAHVFIED